MVKGFHARTTMSGKRAALRVATVKMVANSMAAIGVHAFVLGMRDALTAADGCRRAPHLRG